MAFTVDHVLIGAGIILIAVTIAYFVMEKEERSLLKALFYAVTALGGLAFIMFAIGDFVRNF